MRCRATATTGIVGVVITHEQDAAGGGGRGAGAAPPPELLESPVWGSGHKLPRAHSRATHALVTLTSRATRTHPLMAAPNVRVPRCTVSPPRSRRHSRHPPSTRAQRVLWVKVVPEAPPAAVLDRDYSRLTCESFPADVDALKVAVIASRPKLTGVSASDLCVYHRGDSLPEVDDEAVFLSSTRSLKPFELLRDAVGASHRAFLLVTAALPAGARSQRSALPRRVAPLALSSRFPPPRSQVAGAGPTALQRAVWLRLLRSCSRCFSSRLL